MSTASLTVIVLTFNEEIHIARCINSVKHIAKRIIIVDSGSSDRTCEIAQELGAEIYRHEWVNHSAQLNWAINNCDLNTEWVLKLDADEILIPETLDTLNNSLAQLPNSVTGVTLNLRRYFSGRWLRYGSLYPVRLLRIWRNGYGQSEERLMDEHITVKGDVCQINADFADHNLKGITWWTDKHNDYATKEAIEFILATERDKNQISMNSNLGKQAVLKRWIKVKIYYRLPLGSRALLYFVYRYIIRLGFLDGWSGFVFHILQGFWYRFLVDVKIDEIRVRMKESELSLYDFIENEYGIKVSLPEGKS